MGAVFDDERPGPRFERDDEAAVGGGNRPVDAVDGDPGIRHRFTGWVMNDAADGGRCLHRLD